MEETDSPVPKDYWFGKKYLECMLAQDLARCTALDESVLSIEV